MKIKNGKLIRFREQNYGCSGRGDRLGWGWALCTLIWVMVAWVCTCVTNSPSQGLTECVCYTSGRFVRKTMTRSTCCHGRISRIDYLGGKQGTEHAVLYQSRRKRKQTCVICVCIKKYWKARRNPGKAQRKQQGLSTGDAGVKGRAQGENKTFTQTCWTGGCSFH